ncbi:TPA: hypothetical protein KB475_002063 [Escherichia coli]|uniref:hypothetical protein n=2 Tax=Escherichia coli TaxID=562 RepID=UPI0018667A16|nr:hypothetical protein [Escherichia coli]HBB6609454.1 hypothetical protein [Escherichia coli]
MNEQIGMTPEEKEEAVTVKCPEKLAKYQYLGNTLTHRRGINMIALKMISGMAKSIQIRVEEIKHSPLVDAPLRRQTLRQYAELVLNTIDILLEGKEESGRLPTQEEKILYRRMKLVKRDIHSMLQSVDADI